MYQDLTNRSIIAGPTIVPRPIPQTESTEIPMTEPPILFSLGLRSRARI